MTGGPPGYQEGAVSLGLFSQVTKEEGGGASRVRNILSSISEVGVTIWVGDLGVVGGNDQKLGGGPHGVPPAGDSKYSEPIVQWYLE